mmetsp:Transcript_103170/g.183338  ORF Transcript_103170/g.183338 Transcript_103170/m.183338 type:complete len:102 (+) Transcript_103170:87-392(+)
MERMMPLAVYFAGQKFLTKENVGDIVPENILAYLPMILAGIAYMLVNKMASAQAAAATEGLVGQEAPDFPLKFKEVTNTTTFKEFFSKNKMPTVVDFYQNF